MNPLMQFRMPLLIIVVLAYFGLLSQATAVTPTDAFLPPPPDGCYPNFTTAEGCDALLSLTTGAGNTALGWRSLFSDSTGSFNTGVGAGTLILNTAEANTALGAVALLLNTTGTQNTATGSQALQSNTTGSHNTAAGAFALFSNTIGEFNVANGTSALYSNTTGYGNTALGFGAGSNLTTGSGNVCIGPDVQGVAGASNTTWISNVFASVASGRAVYVNSDNKIGTLSSSRRYKEEVKPMGQASETLFGLKPVTFRYKKEVDRSQALSFGLIAEEVAEISPDLITRDKEGKPETVRYEAVNAMLLNEFLKEHKAFVEQQRKLEEQGATIARQQEQIEALTAGLQKISAQLELNKPAPQTAQNNQ